LLREHCRGSEKIMKESSADIVEAKQKKKKSKKRLKMINMGSVYS